ncbi:MAG: hypothetical protein ACHP84_14650 [Caulobacterales bacterium]
MSVLKTCLVIAVLVTVPGLAVARGGYTPKPPPPVDACGWNGGAMSDPADTQRCLAQRYKPPKPKTTQPRDAQPAPQTPSN